MPLQGPGPLTLFVPTNKAVDRSRDGSIIYMLKEVSIQCEYINICFRLSQLSILLFRLSQYFIISYILAPKGQAQTPGASKAPYLLSGSSKIYLFIYFLLLTAHTFI